MGKAYRRKGKIKFVMIENYVMQTEAWNALNPNEKAAYIELKRRYNAHNNGMIGLGVRDLAAALHSGKDTATRALNGLIDKGFVVKTKPSGFNRKNRIATEWRLTEYPCDLTGALPSKEFTRWPTNNKLTVATEVRTVAPQIQSHSDSCTNSIQQSLNGYCER